MTEFEDDTSLKSIVGTL